MSDEQHTRRGRGLGKKPSKAMIILTIRLPVHVIDYYKKHYPSYTVGMRQVLAAEMARTAKEDN